MGTFTYSDGKGNIGGNDNDMDAKEKRETKTKYNLAKKKRQRTADEKIAYITKWKEI